MYIHTVHTVHTHAQYILYGRYLRDLESVLATLHSLISPISLRHPRAVNKTHSLSTADPRVRRGKTRQLCPPAIAPKSPILSHGDGLLARYFLPHLPPMAIIVSVVPGRTRSPLVGRQAGGPVSDHLGDHQRII